MMALADFWFWARPVMAIADSSQLSGEFVTGLVVAVIGAVGSLFAYKKGQSGTDSSSPLRISMEEQFVTRREFTDFKSEMRTDVSEMKGLFAQTMQKMDIQNENLTKDIKAMGTSAYLGRQKLWEQVNEQRERVSKLEERTSTKPHNGQ